jgi:hypothetical protein
MEMKIYVATENYIHKMNIAIIIHKNEFYVRELQRLNCPIKDVTGVTHKTSIQLVCDWSDTS